MLRNQGTLLAEERSLPWPIGCFINEPVLQICVLSGALFRYWNCSVISGASHVLKVIYLFFTFTFSSYAEGLLPFFSEGSSHFRSQGQDILITLKIYICLYI